MNYTESEQQEVELMAEYTALYYAPRFLQSSLPAEAPIMDLRNIRDIRELRDMAREELNKDPDNRAMRLRQEAAQKNLENIYLHPDYVTQQNIVFSLAGKVKEATDKKIITTRIWQQLQEIGGKVESFPFNPDILKKLEINTIWPEDEQWPDLSTTL